VCHEASIIVTVTSVTIMCVKWQDFRQHGFLTIAIVVSVAALLDMVTPLDYRGGLVVVAVVALVLGWRP
jgi:hypothetical protein